MLYIKETALKLEDSLQLVCSIKDSDKEIKKNIKKYEGIISALWHLDEIRSLKI